MKILLEDTYNFWIVHSEDLSKLCRSKMTREHGKACIFLVFIKVMFIENCTTVFKETLFCSLTTPNYFIIYISKVCCYHFLVNIMTFLVTFIQDNIFSSRYCIFYFGTKLRAPQNVM